MPLYDYHCSQCNHTFEVLHARDGDGPSECPNCQAKSPQRMLSAGNFHLKGGGWYVTDFKDPPKNKTAQDSSSKGTSASTSTDKKSNNSSND